MKFNLDRDGSSDQIRSDEESKSRQITPVSCLGSDTLLTLTPSLVGLLGHWAVEQHDGALEVEGWSSGMTLPPKLKNKHGG